MQIFLLPFHKLTKRLTIQKPNSIFTFSAMFLNQNMTTHHLPHKKCHVQIRLLCTTCNSNLTLFNFPSIKWKALIGHYRVIHSWYSYLLLLSKKAYFSLGHHKHSSVIETNSVAAAEMLKSGKGYESSTNYFAIWLGK